MSGFVEDIQRHYPLSRRQTEYGHHQSESFRNDVEVDATKEDDEMKVNEEMKADDDVKANDNVFYPALERLIYTTLAYYQPF